MASVYIFKGMTNRESLAKGTTALRFRKPAQFEAFPTGLSERIRYRKTIYIDKLVLIRYT